MSKEKSPVVSVPTALHLQSRFFAATRKLWHLLGRLESSVLADELETVKITQPLYVSGLARSGTTILTEMLEKHPAVTSHRYSDFPNIWTPYWRNYLLQKTRLGELEPAERAHKDRIQITNDSPDAFEEVLWMYFFPQAHARGRPNTLDGMVSNPAFESFYRDHIRKLLAVRASSRYLAKGNYNISRFGYILKIFPDARFLVLYRNPVNHIASLIKQHKYFLQAHDQDPRVGKQLAFTGHFEFGPFRNVIHFGDSDAYQGITDAWSAGREVEGWALYWAETYRFLLQQMQSDPALKTSLLLINYEELCERSEQAINRIIDHCCLDHEVFKEVRQYYCEHLRAPAYYQPDFTTEETAIIKRICTPVVTDLDNFRY